VRKGEAICLDISIDGSIAAGPSPILGGNREEYAEFSDAPEIKLYATYIDVGKTKPSFLFRRIAGLLWFSQPKVDSYMNFHLNWGSPAHGGNITPSAYCL
jgi:hypothetical protein